MISLSHHFKQRLLFGTLFFLLVVSLIAFSHTLLGKWAFVLGVYALQAGALVEFQRMSRLKGFRPALSLLLILSFFLILSHGYPFAFGSFYIFFAAFLSLFLTFFQAKEGSLANIAISLFGFSFITIPLSFLVDLNFLPKTSLGAPTSFWLIFLLATVKGNDVASYFCGKAFGKHTLAPSVSPKKTIEGALGGLFASVFLGALLSSYCPTLPSLSYVEGALLGLFLGFFALLGDLSESLLKRDAGVKDSNTLPGLGGLFDIVDSLLFATPFLYLYLLISERL